VTLFPVPCFTGAAVPVPDPEEEEPPAADPAAIRQRRKYAKLTDEEKVSTILLRQIHELEWREIGRQLGRDPSTCHKFYQRWEEKKTLTSRLGRPCKYGPAEVKAIVEGVEENARQSLRAAANTLNPGREWIRLQRKANGYHYYDSIPVPPLDAKARKVRVEFCKEQSARIEFGDNLPVVFSDESTIRMDMFLGGLWRRKGVMKDEAFFVQEQHVMSKMVWGAMTFADEVAIKIGLLACPKRVNSVTYMEMLMMANVFEHLIDKLGHDGFYWQQDNAPAHGPAKDHIVAQRLHVMKWPPHSPDLNPIEMVWAIIKRKLRGREFKDEEELFQAAHEEWKKIPGHVIRNLVGSVLARCKVCVAHDGHCLNGHWSEVHRVHHLLDPDNVPLNPTEVDPSQNVATLVFNS
jgi:hypothetical protein